MPFIRSVGLVVQAVWSPYPAQWRVLHGWEIVSVVITVFCACGLGGHGGVLIGERTQVGHVVLRIELVRMMANAMIV